MKQNILIYCFFISITIHSLVTASLSIEDAEEATNIMTSQFDRLDLNKVAQCQQALDFIIDNHRLTNKNAPLQALLHANDNEFRVMLNDLPFYCALDMENFSLSTISIDDKIICNNYQDQANELIDSIVSNWNPGKKLKNKALASLSKMTALIAGACQNKILNKQIKKEIKLENKLQPQQITLNLTTNYVQCLRDVEVLVPQLVTVIRDIKNHTQVQAMLGDLLSLVIDLTHTVADCGMLPSDEETIADEAISCIHDAQVIEPGIRDIIDEVEQKNITILEVIRRLHAVFTQNNQAFLKDCGLQAFVDDIRQSDACVNDLSAMKQDLISLVTGQITSLDQLKELVSDMVHNLSSAIQDCVNK